MVRSLIPACAPREIDCRLTKDLKFPAEIFPTRYRCACLGISAAAGKFGSVVAQLALRHTQFNALSNCQNLSDTRLGGVLIGSVKLPSEAACHCRC